MGFGSSPVPPAPAWPVTSDPGPRVASRPDMMAAVLLVLGGVCALLPWFLTSYLIGSTAGVGLSGSDLVFGLRNLDGGWVYDVTALAVLGSAVGGGALIVLGVAALFPMTHRPIGVAALLIAVFITGAAGWLLLKSASVLNTSVGEMLTGGHFAWHLTAAAALLGVIGSIRAIVVR